MIKGLEQVKERVNAAQPLRYGHKHCARHPEYNAACVECAEACEEQERAVSVKPVKMTIESHVPSKWRFVDLETGDVWKWDLLTGRFKAAEEVVGK